MNLTEILVFASPIIVLAISVGFALHAKGNYERLMTAREKRRQAAAKVKPPLVVRTFSQTGLTFFGDAGMMGLVAPEAVRTAVSGGWMFQGGAPTLGEVPPSARQGKEAPQTSA